MVELRALVAATALLLLAAAAATAQRGAGIKIGAAGAAGASPAGRGSGLKVGGSGSRLSRPTVESPGESSAAAEGPDGPYSPFGSEGPHEPSPGPPAALYIGLVVPYKAFGSRDYTKAVTSAVSGLQRKFTLFKKTELKVHTTMLELTPTPNTILNSLCKEFLRVNVSAILYLMNYEQYGRSTASAQYFLQLAGYLGIPVIAWNADNSGLERRASPAGNLQLQLAPSVEHQAAAMLSILERYKWHRFSIVTSQIAGHDDFVQAVRERVNVLQDKFKLTVLNTVVVGGIGGAGELGELVSSEARVLLLYATRDEAAAVLAAARDLQLTGDSYVWIVAQSVLANLQAPAQFPVGMLGVHFDTSSMALVNEIGNAIKVFAQGSEEYMSGGNRGVPGARLSCESAAGASSGGRDADEFFRRLRSASVDAAEPGRPPIEFTETGDLRAAELKIVNLRPSANKHALAWEEIGAWRSWHKEELDIKDIVWPGGSHTPPQGVPEKFHLRITFLEEPPFISLAPPDPVTGRCSLDRGVLCRHGALPASAADSEAGRNGTANQCCSGLCIDLLEKLAEELGFTYELARVEDGKWGTLLRGRWNGLIHELVGRRTDMVLASLAVNSDREGAVDFTVPFMETGIAVLVAKRTGIISPTAFLEPFDAASWMLVGIAAIQAAAFAIFLFEWLSPSGFDMSARRSRTQPHRFSLFRTYWLVWAVLFQAAVHVDSPRGFTARFVTNVWATFAVVFLAIYTANLAAFMITREEFHEFSGLDDRRLNRPLSQRPALKFGTVPWSHTDATLGAHFGEMHAHMRAYNRSTAATGAAAVLSADLDAFIYDGTVLDYLASQDEDCRLLTVGSWYAMTGYALAFPRRSKYLHVFNRRLLEYRSNGDLERLRRYWTAGSCKPNKRGDSSRSSDPLALEQFLSAFLLLMAGVLLAALLLLMEHVYWRYARRALAASKVGPCCALVSLSMGESLTFRAAAMRAAASHGANCRGGVGCRTALRAARDERDAARRRARQLAAALRAHGLRVPPLAGGVAPAAIRDATRPRALSPERTLDPALTPPRTPARTPTHAPRTPEKEVAEMETVL